MLFIVKFKFVRVASVGLFVKDRNAKKSSDLTFGFVVVTLPLPRSDSDEHRNTKNDNSDFDFVSDFVSDCKSMCVLSLVDLMLSRDVPVHLNSNGCEVAWEVALLIDKSAGQIMSLVDPVLTD